MHRFATAAVLVVAMSAPVFAGAALMDHSAITILGQPGGCSSSCDVGGKGAGGLNSGGNAQGSYQKEPDTGFGTFTQAGTPGTGRITLNNPPDQVGTQSGNYPKLVGHCTGYLSC
jgi:opacity protein-like surface antigen